jgi:hypothetical protein
MNRMRSYTPQISKYNRTSEELSPVAGDQLRHSRNEVIASANRAMTRKVKPSENPEIQMKSDRGPSL